MHNLPHYCDLPSYRLRYLEGLRFELRGEDPETIDDILAQMDVAIQDMIENDPAAANIPACTECIEVDALALRRIKDHRSAGMKGCLQDISVAERVAGRIVGQRAKIPCQERAYAMLAIEKRVVRGLLQPKQMARSFRPAMLRRKLIDPDTLWLDGCAIAFGIVLCIAPLSGPLDTPVPHLLGVLPIILGIVSGIIRRLPVGRLTRSAYRLLSPIRILTIIGALAIGTSGAASMAFDMQIVYGAHEWSVKASVTNMPQQIAAMVCALLLMTQTRLLVRLRRTLKFRLDLDAYRNDRYGYLKEDELDRGRAVGYFTEEAW